MSEELLIFCRNLKFLRKIHSISQKEMAQICGISISSLRKIEKGVLPPRLSVEPVLNLSSHFSLPPSVLFAPLEEHR